MREKKIIEALNIILKLFDRTMPMAGIYTDYWEEQENRLKDILGELEEGGKE